jgi:cytochrome c oxidase subunit 2
MILANLNEKITTDVIIKNSSSSILESNILEFESNILKSAFDYGDDCNEDGSCSCGGGHNKIELPDKTTVLESEEMDTNTIIHGIDSIVIENLILGQSDMNIPIIALQMGVIFLMGLIIEVSNAWKGIRIKNKVKSLVWKKDNNKSGPKFLDAPVSWGLYFQDAASPSFEGIVDLHNRIMFYLVIISFGVSWVMLSVMTNFNYSSNKLVYRHLNHGTLIELIWTVGPALVLVAIAFPSFKLLYLMDEVIDPAMTVKVTGHQWFWEYEYADFLNEENEAINFDSYMKDESILEKGQLRMLEVDNSLLLPIDTHIRFVITAADVLHDWALPSLSLKVDACPGRLNQASVIIERPGLLFGQCSEICGVLHSSMPINIEAVEVEKFFLWLLEQ